MSNDGAMTSLASNARKLRILHVLRAPVGGLFRHVLDLSRAQIARGHAVGLIVDSQTGGPRADEALAALAPQLKLGIMRVPMRRQPHVSDINAMRKIFAQMNMLKPDVVHGHGSKGGLYARLPGFWSRGSSPVRCYTPHGGSFHYWQAKGLHRLYMLTERMLRRATDVFIFESEFIAQRFRDTIGGATDKIAIAQNGVGPDEFEPITHQPDAADFIYVGEFSIAKGIDTLIEALSVLNTIVKPAPRLVLVGAGAEKASVAAQAEKFGLSGNIIFLPPMPARQAFAMGKILVVPSRMESLPYIVLEAAAANVPLLATRVGGIPEIFGPLQSQLVPANDPAALAIAMQKALAQAPQFAAAEAQQRAAYVAAHFDISQMADKVLAGYELALKSSQSHLSEASAIPKFLS